MPVWNRPAFTVRTFEPGDIPALVELLAAYMQETFGAPWKGTVEALNRDGLGTEFETEVAVSSDGYVIGFASWHKAYDLHHCITGGEIMDMYVTPANRGYGVAPALVYAVSARVFAQGGKYLRGKAVENRMVQRLYERLAVCFPGADCIVGGRAFRRLAELIGQSPKSATRRLPDKSWNYEP